MSYFSRKCTWCGVEYEPPPHDGFCSKKCEAEYLARNRAEYLARREAIDARVRERQSEAPSTSASASAIEPSPSSSDTGCLSRIISRVGALILLLLFIGAIGGQCTKRREKAQQIEQQRQADENRRRAEEQRRIEDARRLEVERNAQSTKAKETIAKDRSEKTLAAQFAVEQLPEVWSVMSDLRALQKDSEIQMNKLRAQLEALGRSADEDADYQTFGVKRNQLSMALSQLEADLEQTYVEYLKYKSAPDSASISNAIRTAMNEGKESATRARATYESIKNELIR